VDNNGIPFDKVNDKIYLNGDFLNWPTWNNSLPEMTNNPVGSDYYEQTVTRPGGSPRRLQFKFGLDGPGHGFLDNENPTYSDHVKYVRDNNAPCFSGFSWALAPPRRLEPLHSAVSSSCHFNPYRSTSSLNSCE